MKPAQFGGRLNGLESLRRKCSCPRDFQHQVIQVFRTTLSLEWWRHLEKFHRAELTQLQKNWIKSKEKRKRGNKRSWGEEDIMKDHMPDPNKNTKKARKEFQNQYFVGGMRIPAISVKRLGLVKEAGQDILRLWNAFLKEHPAALDAARSYGTDRCKLDDRVATEWTLRLGRLLKVEPQAAVKLKGIVEGVAEVCQGPG